MLIKLFCMRSSKLFHESLILFYEIEGMLISCCDQCISEKEITELETFREKFKDHLPNDAIKDNGVCIFYYRYDKNISSCIHRFNILSSECDNDYGIVDPFRCIVILIDNIFRDPVGIGTKEVISYRVGQGIRKLKREFGLIKRFKRWLISIF